MSSRRQRKGQGEREKESRGHRLSDDGMVVGGCTGYGRSNDSGGGGGGVHSEEGSEVSGGESPRSYDSGIGGEVKGMGMVGKEGLLGERERDERVVCFCRRDEIRAYGRCGYCLREAGLGIR